MLNALTRWTDAALTSLADRLRDGGLGPEILAAGESLLPGQFDAWRLPVVTHRFHFSQFQEAFDIMRSGQSGKIILDWSN